MRTIQRMPCPAPHRCHVDICTHTVDVTSRTEIEPVIAMICLRRCGVRACCTHLVHVACIIMFTIFHIIVTLQVEAVFVGCRCRTKSVC